MNVPYEIYMAVNARRIPEKFRGKSCLELLRAGYDTSDIALFKFWSEALVYNAISSERKAKRFGRAA